MGLLISRIVLTAIFVYLTFLVWTNNVDIWRWFQNKAKSTLPITENKVPVELSIKKKFEVNVSLTEFSKANANWASTDSLCCATFNIMNVGDFPFTIQDFFITASLDEDGTKSVHRALNENGKKLNPVVVDPDKSSVVKAYFDVRKAICAVPDKIGKRLDLYSDIVVEAIARDGLRENLIFKNNTLKTEVFELDKNYSHKLLHVMSPYRTSAIRFLGNHANEGYKKMRQEDTNATPVKMMQSITGDDNIQATTTGDNSPINQTVNKGPSLEDMEAVMRKVLQEKEISLNTKYGSNYAVGAIAPDHFVGLKGEVPSGIEIKWKTGRVINMSSEYIQVKMPQIVWGGLSIEGNTITLPKKVGATQRPLALGGSVIVFEVIGINQDIVTVCLAIVAK